MFDKVKKNRDQEKDAILQQKADRFFTLIKSLMDEVFKYASKKGHVMIPTDASFGLIYDKSKLSLLTGVDKQTGKKMYFYNTRIIAKTFEARKEEMLVDTTPNSLFMWVGDLLSLYIEPFVFNYVINKQHRGKAAAERTTRQLVKGFLSQLTNDPELRYILDSMKGPSTKRSK